MAGSAGTCSPLRMSLTSGPFSVLNQHERDAPPVGVPDLLAELRRGRRHLDGNAAAPQLRGRPHRVGAGPPRRPARPARRSAYCGCALSNPWLISRAPAADTPIEIPTPGYVVRPSEASESYRPPPADRPEPLVADQVDLVDGAGVVVQAAGDPQVGHQQTGRVLGGRAPSTWRQPLEALVQEVVLDTERADPLDERRVRDRDRRPARGRVPACSRSAPASIRQRRPPSSGPILSSLSTIRSTVGHVVDAEAAVEALGDLAVVDLDHGTPAPAACAAPPRSPAAARPRSGTAARRCRRCRCRPG